MHFFSTPDFFAAAQAAYPSIAAARPADVSVAGGARYRALVDRRSQPLTSLPFADYLAPIAHDDPSTPTTVCVRHLDNVALELIDVGEFASRQAALGLDVTDPVSSDGSGGRRTICPLVDWTTFTSVDDFVAAARSADKRAFRQTRRKVSLTEREFGAAPTFTFDDPNRSRFEQCLEWKSAQYLAGGNPDLVGEGAGAMMRRLHEAGLLVVSTLCANERLLAAHVGFVHDDVFHYWLPAYDAAAAKAAPGLHLLELMLMASYEHGHSAFDFLEGQESYKFRYATHVRLVGTVGTPHAARRAARRLLRRVGREIRRHPKLGAAFSRLRTIPAAVRARR